MLNVLNHIFPMQAHKPHPCDPFQFANSFVIWNSDAAWIQILLLIIYLPSCDQNMKSHCCIAEQIVRVVFKRNRLIFHLFCQSETHIYLIDILLIPEDLSCLIVTYRLQGHGYAGSAKKWPSQAVCFQMLSCIRMTLCISQYIVGGGFA